MTKLADWLYEHSKNPEQLKFLLGIKHRSTVWRWITGERIPGPRVLHQIEKLTKGEVTLRDFLDPSPPKCARIIIDPGGEPRTVYPWSAGYENTRNGITQEDSRLSQPMLTALAELKGQAWFTPSGHFLLNGRVCGARDIIIAANHERRKRGEPPIPYPGVEPLDD